MLVTEDAAAKVWRVNLSYKSINFKGQQIVMTTTEIIVAIAIAVIGSNGIWALMAKICEKKTSIKDDIEALRTAICGLKIKLDDIEELGQANKELAKATARDRLNSLNHKYRDLGYIRKDDYVSYKLIGEAYEKSEGNTIVREEFDVNMKELQRK